MRLTRTTTPTAGRSARLVLAVVAGLAAVAAVLAAVAPLAQGAGGVARTPVDLDHAATYTCQYSGLEGQVPTVPGGLPTPVLPALGGSDDVSVAVEVRAPRLITPGQALKLRGSVTFTFGPNATATNAATVFSFLSDDFGVNVTVDGQRRFLRITDLTTTESTASTRDVTATWKLPEFLVPSAATGRVALSLPEGALVTNPVSTTPESVDFTGQLRTDSSLEPEREVACALDQGQQTEIGSVRVLAASTGPSPSTTTPTSTTTGPTASTATTPPAATPPPGASGSGPLPGPATDPPVGLPGLTPTTAPEAPQVPGATPSAPPAALPTVLAGEPIPPATVSGGLRLPPWALLFLGGFIASGVGLAVSSRRRLKQAAVVGLALTGLLVVPSPLNPRTPASAATGQAQVTLVCVYEAEGSAANDVPKDQPTGMSITLDTPDSVAPGEVISLTGSASIQAPEDIRNQASQLGYNTLDAVSDTFSVGVTVGSGKRQVFGADRWQTGKTAFGNPLVVKAPLYFPSFKVPDDASGSISLELPRNEVVDRRPAPYRNAHTPPRVALELLASVSGNGTSATYIVSCWRSDKGSGLIATIPVSAPGGTTSTAGPTTGGTTPAGGSTPPSAAAPGAGQPTVPGQTLPAGQTTAPVTGGGPVTAGAPTPDQPTVPGTAPTAGQVVPGTGTTVPVGAAPVLVGAGSVPAITSAQPGSQDLVVPTWLALLVGLSAVGAFGYAGWNYSRLRSLETRSGPGGRP